MNIYVISLKKSPRRKEVNSRLEKLGLPFSFIDATDKEEIPSKHGNIIYDEESCILRHGRGLVQAEIACFMSHLKTWEIIAKSNSHAIILEDDAKLTETFKNAKEILESEKINADVILLGHSKLKKNQEANHYFHNPIFKHQKYGTFSVGNAFKLWTSGTVGYYVTCQGAQKLIDCNKKIRCVSDDWAHHSDHGVLVKEIRPYPVWEDFENMPSYIEDDRHKASKHRRKFVDSALEPARFARAIYRNALALIYPRTKQD